MFKLLLVGGFLAAIASLLFALFNIAKPNQDKKRTAKALTWRIGISLGLFLLLAVFYFAGLIKPQGIGANIAKFGQMNRLDNINKNK